MRIKRNALTAALSAALLLGSTAASLAITAVATGDVNVRRGPGTGYAVVDQLYEGEDVDVRGCSGGWCRIEHAGPDGWVSARYLTRDTGFYGEDDGDPDFFIRRPYRPHYRPYYDPYPGNYVCFGGPNARFCISD